MDAHLIWGYIHILLFVFWLTADMAVAAKLRRVRDANLPYETRAAILHGARRLSIVPRVCFALTLPSGVHLADEINIYPVEMDLIAGGWAFGLFWLVNGVCVVRKWGTPRGNLLRQIQLATQAFAGLVFTIIGLNSLATSAPVAAFWFSVKLLLFGVSFWAVIAADVLARPLRAPFREIGEEGTTPEREESVTRAINNSLRASVVLYLVIAAAAVLGAAQPY